jgi:hypothetical protein
LYQGEKRVDRLVSVIGKAPSETSMEEFALKLRGERKRVMEELRLFREGLGGKVKGRKSVKPRKGLTKKEKELREALAAEGISLDDFLEGMKDGD